MELSTIKRRFNKEFKWVTYPNPLVKAAPRIWNFILEYFEPKSNQVKAGVSLQTADIIKIINEMIKQNRGHKNWAMEPHNWQYFVGYKKSLTELKEKLSRLSG